MSYSADIRISGVDVLNEHGMYTDDIQGFGPIQPVKRDFGFSPGALKGTRSPETFNPRKVTISGTIAPSSYLDMHIEQIGELVGWYGDRYKETTLSISQRDIVYVVVIESFDVQYIKPVFIQPACKFKMSFRVIGTLRDTSGVMVDRAWNITSTYRYVYYEDSYARHGMTNTVHRIEATGSGFIIMPVILCYATSDEFTDIWGTPITTGTHPVVDGSFGTPAINFAAAGNNTLKYQVIYGLPITGISAVSIAIKFLRNFSIGDGNTHILLGDDYGLSRTFLGFLNNANSDITFGNGSRSVSVSAAATHKDLWNTVVVTCDTGQMKIRLSVQGQDDLTDSINVPGTFPDPGSYFWIGTASAGNYRSDCKIDEVTIWKHPLTDEGSIAAGRAILPMRQMFEQGLKLRMTFYQNFSNGFQAVANRGNWLSCNIPISNAQLIIDSERRTMKHLNLSNYAITDYIGYLGSYPSYGSEFPVLERYNKYYIFPGTSSSRRLIISGMPIRRL